MVCYLLGYSSGIFKSVITFLTKRSLSLFSLSLAFAYSFPMTLIASLNSGTSSEPQLIETFLKRSEILDFGKAI